METPQQSKNSGGRYWTWPLPLATLWLLLPVIGVLIRLSLAAIDPYDYWWSMAMGKLISWYAEIPKENLFLYTIPADAPFMNQPWLAQWGMYALLERFGHAGPFILRNLLAVLTWAALILGAMRRDPEPRVVGGLALFGVALSAPVMSVRTQIFSFLPFVCLVWIVLAVSDKKIRPAWLFALSPLCALWANLHGTFILVPVILTMGGGAALIQDWLKTRTFSPKALLSWAGAALASALAATLNPIGPKIYAYVWELSFTSEVSDTVTEWQPPGVDDFFSVVLIILLFGSLAVLFFRRKHVRLVEAVLYAATLYLALSAVRNIFWWVAVVMLITPRHLHALLKLKPWWEGKTSSGQGLIHAAVLGALLAASVLVQPGLPLYAPLTDQLVPSARTEEPGRRILSQASPMKLVEQLSQLGYPGQIFHAQEAGGLLNYALGTPASAAAKSTQEPTRQVSFVDQRMELIPAEIWDDYFTLTWATQGWQEIIEEHNIQTLLLYAKGQRRLLNAVQADPGWTLVGIDEAYLLYFRADQTRYIGRWRSLDSAEHPAEHK